MLYKQTFIFLALLLSLSSLAQDNPSTLDVYADYPEISLMTISPDGTRIAYRALKDDRELLLIKEIDSGNTVRW